MSRVLSDIITMGGVFILVIIAFSSGLVFIITNESYSNNYARLNSTHASANLSAYVETFADTAYLLLWTMLDPGPKDEISDEGIRGVFATIVLMVYQVALVIVLLNLLIAVMNSTVQKFQDRRQVYWKFTRTSIWMEYFDDYSALPIPFSIINITWYVTTLLLKGCKRLYRRIYKHRSRKKSSIFNSKGHETLKSKQIEARTEHTQLMLTLMSRFRKKDSEDDWKKSDMEQLKIDILKHLESANQAK